MCVGGCNDRCYKVKEWLEGVDSLLLSCLSQGSNPDFQAWLQVPLTHWAISPVPTVCCFKNKFKSVLLLLSKISFKCLWKITSCQLYYPLLKVLFALATFITFSKTLFNQLFILNINKCDFLLVFPIWNF